MNRYVFVSSIFLVLILAGCSDLGEAPVDDFDHYTGTIRDNGSGFFVLTSDRLIGSTHTVYPTNLPPDFRRDGLRVVFSGHIDDIEPNAMYAYLPLRLSLIQAL